jgi:prepilin-type N-terminal cleavage/methylation domain-containing protein
VAPEEYGYANQRRARPTVDPMRRLLYRLWPTKGFTFNELLVAMSIIAVAVLGLSLTTIAVIRGNQGNSNFAAAVNLAHDKMEELKASKTLAVADRCPAAGDNGITGLGAPGGIFGRCWRIATSGLGSRLKQVDVTVYWRDSEAHEITLSSLIFMDEAH